MNLTGEKKQLFSVVLLWMWCGSLLLYAVYVAADNLAVGLLWNLLLATLPLFWSTGFQSASEKRQRVPTAVFFSLWLLFLPNAPYLLTDLIHLKERPPLPHWYVLVMLLSCAGAGTLFGYFSLANIHACIEGRYGKRSGWVVAAGSLMLCGLGIYVGRFLRWNSWDAITNPTSLVSDVIGKLFDSGIHPHPVTVTLIFGVGLVIGYLVLMLDVSPLCDKS